jgi:superfamily II DNA or RNA helicase
MQATIIRWGDGYVHVEPAFPDTLLKKLKYWRRSLEWSEEQMRRIASGQFEELYNIRTWIDPQTQQYCQQLTTLPGFVHRIKEALKEAGWTYTVIDERTPMPEPNLHKAFSGLYDHQLECAYVALKSGGGIIACPTGWGKTHIMKAMVNAYTSEALKLRGTPLTVVSAPDKDIAAKDYRDLKAMLPNREVGLVMTGHSNFSDDVQVITLDSLHRINADEVGVLIVDEVHASASDKRADSIVAMRRAVRWGVSATPTGRFDGRDLVTEGLFGPVVYTRTYGDGVKDGALVPITVYWVKCPEPAIGMPKFEAYSTRVGRYRNGVWRNKNRNAFIGDIMRRIPDSMQTLCIMQYLDQMDEIYPLCGTGTTMVHAVTDQVGLSKFKNLISITPAERREIYRKMEAAEIKRILSTYVYKQGVNFPHLAVVINAGGGGSDIVAKQIPGRESRKTATKERAYLVDFWHPWDKVKNDKERWVAGPIYADDQSREKAYNHLGFEQVWVEDLNGLPFLEQPRTSVE